MRMTTKTRLAITAMLEIAMSDKLVKVSELADLEGVSESYMEQIFKLLREAGFVEGTRGPGGGYRLGMSAGTITLADIVSAVTPENIAVKVRPAVEAYLDLNARLWEFMNELTLDECVKRHMRAAA